MVAGGGAAAAAGDASGAWPGRTPVAAAISLSSSSPVMDPAKVSSAWPDTLSLSRSKSTIWMRVPLFFAFFLPLPATFST
jgi:hypothetical protein